jgi:hypothetical protein
MRKAVHILWRIALAIVIVSSTRSNAQDERSKGPGAVFVMTNAADQNEIISFKRAADGSLQEDRKFATGGRGSGGNNDPLGHRQLQAGFFNSGERSRPRDSGLTCTRY